MAQNTNKTEYSSSCPITPICGCCKLLKDGRYLLSDCGVTDGAGTVTLKKKSNGTDRVFPLTTEDIEFLGSNCVEARLESCNSEGERVTVSSYDSANGILTLDRESPISHKGDTYINFGEVSVELINKMLSTLCDMYEAYCGKFPPYASEVRPGIGTASFIADVNAGQAPVFITKDDPNWVQFIASIGGDLTDSSVGEFFAFLSACTDCEDDAEERTNFLALQNLLTILCGREGELTTVLDNFTGFTTGDCGIEFDTPIKANCGITGSTLHSNKAVGGYNTGVIQAWSPIVQGAPLEESFSGRTSTADDVYVGEIEYDTASVTLICDGRLKIHGDLTTGWGDGSTRGKLVVKSTDADGNTVIEETLTTFVADGRGSERGISFSPYNHTIDQGSYIESTEIYSAGQVLTLCWVVDFALEIGQTSTERAAIYKYAHEVEFVPVCN